MGRPRRKPCPDCDQIVASSSGICSCGSSIEPTKKRPNSDAQVEIRRTERTKRRRPSYYDSLAAEQKTEERRRHDKAVEQAPKVRPSSPAVASTQSNRMQLTVKKVSPGEPEIKEEELEEIVLSDEMRTKFSAILDDINRKICASSWKGFL